MRFGQMKNVIWYRIVYLAISFIVDAFAALCRSMQLPIHSFRFRYENESVFHGSLMSMCRNGRTSSAARGKRTQRDEKKIRIRTKRGTNCAHSHVIIICNNFRHSQVDDKIVRCIQHKAHTNDEHSFVFVLLRKLPFFLWHNQAYAIKSPARHIINFYKNVHLTGIYKLKFIRTLMLLPVACAGCWSGRNAAINCHLDGNAIATKCVYAKLFFGTYTNSTSHTHMPEPNCSARMPNWFIENIYANRVASA